MEITYMVIVTLVTLILGAITKTFIDKIPDKFIPMQNLIIGIISATIVYFTKIEPNILQAIVLCLTATMSAGGIYDLSMTNFKKAEE